MCSSSKFVSDDEKGCKFILRFAAYTHKREVTTKKHLKYMLISTFSDLANKLNKVYEQSVFGPFVLYHYVYCKTSSTNI